MQNAEFRCGRKADLKLVSNAGIGSDRESFFCLLLRHESMAWLKAGLFFASLILLVSAICGTNASAQAVYGSIAGTVYDSSGAGVPKAAVTISDLQRNVNYSTATNDSGNYSQTHLIIGRYRVRVELAGFKAAVQENVSLAVDTITTVEIGRAHV